jgi:hypothetical protein
MSEDNNIFPIRARGLTENEQGEIVKVGPTGEYVEERPVGRHGPEQELRNIRAAVWGALGLFAQGRHYQATTLLESCLPDGYRPVGDPEQEL